MRIGRDPPLVIVLKIQVADLSFFKIDPKSETPVAGDIEAPYTLSIACQGVRLPRRERTQLPRFIHVTEKREHLPEFVPRIGWQALGFIVEVKLLQALVDKTPNV